MASQFSSNKNKGFLWNLMLEADVFGGVPTAKKDDVVNIFEQTISEVGLNNNGNLIEMNKAVIMKVNNKLNPLRQGGGVQTQMQNNEPPKLVTAAEISANRKERFNVNLSERQKQFDDMMVPKKPAEVDFADKDEEKPIGSEMDDMLAKMMARREQQLNQVMQSQDTNAAQNWISNDGSGTNTGPPTLQIGEELTNPNVEEVKPKPRVTFSETIQEDTEDNILSLFKTKTKTGDKEEIIKKINDIELKVNEIVQVLNALKKII